MSRVFIPTPATANAFLSAFDSTGQTLENLYAIAPWLDGKQFDVGTADSPLSGATTTQINHYFGKVVSGFLVTNVVTSSAATGSGGVYYRDTATNDTNSISLYSEASVIRYSVWLY